MTMNPKDLENKSAADLNKAIKEIRDVLDLRAKENPMQKEMRERLMKRSGGALEPTFKNQTTQRLQELLATATKVLEQKSPAPKVEPKVAGGVRAAALEKERLAANAAAEATKAPEVPVVSAPVASEEAPPAPDAPDAPPAPDAPDAPPAPDAPEAEPSTSRSRSSTQSSTKKSWGKVDTGSTTPTSTSQGSTPRSVSPAAGAAADIAAQAKARADAMAARRAAGAAAPAAPTSKAAAASIAMPSLQSRGAPTAGASTKKIELTNEEVLQKLGKARPEIEKILAKAPAFLNAQMAAFRKQLEDQERRPSTPSPRPKNGRT